MSSQISLDALSMAVAYWVDHKSRDTQKAAQTARERALDRDIEDFVNNVFNKKSLPQNTGWIGCLQSET